jgi:hypothetical protein
MDAMATVPGPSFDPPPLSLSVTDVTVPASPQPRTAGAEPATPKTTGPVPSLFAAEMAPGEANTQPAASKPLTPSPVHNAETATYTVPDSIRAAAVHTEAPDLSLGAIGAGLSAEDVAAIDLDSDNDTTAMQASATLTAGRDAHRAQPAESTTNTTADTTDIPSADADLIDDGEVVMLPEGPSALFGEMGPDGDPFASAGAISSDGTIHLGSEDANRIERIVELESGNGVAIGRLVAQPVAAEAPTALYSGAHDGPLPPTPGRGWSLGVKLLTTTVGVVVLALGVIVFQSGGRIDLSLIGLGAKDRANEGALATVAGYKDVLPVAMRSVLYPTRAGRQILVFVGKAENRSGQPRQDIDAVAELHDREGRLVAAARSPLGLTLGPAELSGLTDQGSLAAAWRERVGKQAPPVVPSRATAPFTVVLFNPPAKLSDLVHSVRLDKSEPRVVAPLPPPPVPPVEISAEETASDDTNGSDDKLKSKKGKRKRAKRKTKAGDESGDLTPPPG